MAQANKRFRVAHGDAELLGEFALEPGVRILANRQLAAWKFPAPGHMAPTRALRDQYAAFRVRDRACNHMNFSQTCHPWSAHTSPAQRLASGVLQCTVAMLEFPP
jgi:hypothetical protein